jgi:predicted component of type VI protein secretion system
VALGACIGLAVGLAQVMLKEAWVRVDAGFRPGRELILTKPEITLGRAESCDVGLFGGQGVEKLHARITRQGDRFLLADAGTPGGTLLNGTRLIDPAPLRDGDRIQMGNCILTFGERRKEPAA